MLEKNLPVLEPVDFENYVDDILAAVKEKMLSEKESVEMVVTINVDIEHAEINLIAKKRDFVPRVARFSK